MSKAPLSYYFCSIKRDCPLYNSQMFSPTGLKVLVDTGLPREEAFGGETIGQTSKVFASSGRPEAHGCGICLSGRRAEPHSRGGGLGGNLGASQRARQPPKSQIAERTDLSQ
jgi:hypothetical protein